MNRLLISALLACAPLTASNAAPPTPPSNPKAQYLHASMRVSEHGAGPDKFWLYEPQQPAPEKPPLVIFLHGWSAMEPSPYAGWIEHITRSGCVVIFPLFQDKLLTPPSQFQANTASAIRLAQNVLAEKDRVTPDYEKVAVVGHSIGGVGSIIYASRAVQDHLPVPKAVFAVEPGAGSQRGIQYIVLEGLSQIPEKTLLAVLVGDRDKLVGDVAARRIWTLTSQVTSRAYFTLQTDEHGKPMLNANHYAPLAFELTRSDALDWYGMWRTFDDMRAAAFSKSEWKPVLDMGKWSDGTLVKPLLAEPPSVTSTTPN